MASTDTDSLVAQLMAMGYDHSASMEALKKTKNDVSLAAQYLIDGQQQKDDKNKKTDFKQQRPQICPSKPSDDDIKTSESIKGLMEMGFEYDAVSVAMKKCKGNKEKAVQYLLLNANKPKNTLSKDSKAANLSSYYLYKGTSKEEFEKYKPKKIEKGQNTQVVINKNKKGSQWNSGATMEQFDYSEWMKRRIKELLLNNVRICCENKVAMDEIKLTEVTSVEGDATFILTRGKLRPGYDISFTCKWKGKVDGKEVDGKLFMNDITLGEDEEDWEYYATVSESKKEFRKAKGIMQKDVNRQAVVNVVKLLIKEFLAKKQ